MVARLGDVLGANGMEGFQQGGQVVFLLQRDGKLIGSEVNLGGVAEQPVVQGAGGERGRRRAQSEDFKIPLAKPDVEAAIADSLGVREQAHLGRDLVDAAALATQDRRPRVAALRLARWEIFRVDGVCGMSPAESVSGRTPPCCTVVGELEEANGRDLIMRCPALGP